MLQRGTPSRIGVIGTENPYWSRSIVQHAGIQGHPQPGIGNQS
ncbi:hypothetical protein GbCGDNIH5_8166 [Granulibacter bethesdensis]|nr:hypothetical protein GbCGDNIH5_8166 [Granulibacter bethesdensis]